MEKQKPISVVIIEDDETIRKGFTYLINTSEKYRVINSYSNVESALTKLGEDAPDVVLLDIELPGIKGVDAIPKIKHILPKTYILMLTVYENEDNVFNALTKGASGYLVKSDSTEKIMDAIQEVVDGGAPMSMNVAKIVIKSFHKNQNTPLTKRETEILEQVANGKSRSKIAKEMFIDLETVKSHIKHIYTKLNVHSREDAIKEAKNNKYI
ncbi:response regulator transcription factor [Aurantibacillus circumpalustris]|uniref:response regulator transcription factor n=1 Tax=Aurantibacillus circumpalustris TaxID=3036359 RepID=UPI00295BB58A|nr:response regulator transcription factor [Aurantibacillus circumpalustris]